MRSLAVVIAIALGLSLAGYVIAIAHSKGPPRADCVGRLIEVAQHGEQYPGERMRVEQDCHHH